MLTKFTQLEKDPDDSLWTFLKLFWSKIINDARSHFLDWIISNELQSDENDFNIEIKFFETIIDNVTNSKWLKLLSRHRTDH